MRKYILYTAVFCLPVLMAFTSVPDWVNFESKGSGFSVLFPENPVESNQTVDAEIGTLNLKIFTCDVYEKQSMVYMAAVTDFPADKISSDKKEIVDKVFRDAIDGGVKNVEGSLLSEKEIKLKKYPGREFKISFQDGAAVILAKAYLVKNTMYILQAITLKDKESDPAIARFMNSFALL